MSSAPLRVASHLTRLASAYSRRPDVLVRVNNAIDGRAQFDHLTAQIHLNLTGILNPDELAAVHADPATVTAHPRLLGALAHEASHADHTHRRNLPAHIEAWAALLEEPRIERVLVDEHPAARAALAASAATVIGHPRDGNPIEAMELLILLGGRVNAGIIAADAAQSPLNRALGTLGETRGLQVQQIVKQAVALDDNDLTGLADLATQLHTIATDYDQHPTPAAPPGHSPSAATVTVDEPAVPADSQDHPNDDDDHDEAPQRDLDDDEPPHPPTVADPPVAQQYPPAYVDGNPKFFPHAVGNTRARDWFTVTVVNDDDSTSRAATAADYRAVRRFGSWLAGHYRPAEITTQVPALAPPGQVRMPELVRATAQHELGLTVTAAPWRRRRRREQPTAPVDLGLIVDRSDSMGPHMSAVADATWVLTQAMSTPVGRAQTWLFSDRAQVLPATAPDRIITAHAGGPTVAMLPAIMDYRRWARPHGAARLLIIISDGALYGDPVRAELARLAATGVHIVGLAPAPQFTAALANHLPASAPITALGPNLLEQVRPLIEQATS